MIFWGKVLFCFEILLMKFLKLTPCLCIFFFNNAFSQLKLPGNNSLKSDFQKIVTHYPHHFDGIRGNILNQNPQTIEYASVLKVGDAEECTIIKYSSGLKSIYSWQGVMFVSEDFEEASKKYKWLFNQLKGLNIFYVKDQYTLKGSFEEADETRKFSSSILSPDAPPDPLKKLRVEIALLFEFPEWKVNLFVYEKEREDDERGEIAE